jgi:hypothetical protein
VTGVRFGSSRGPDDNAPSSVRALSRVGPSEPLRCAGPVRRRGDRDRENGERYERAFEPGSPAGQQRGTSRPPDEEAHVPDRVAGDRHPEDGPCVKFGPPWTAIGTQSARARRYVAPSRSPAAKSPRRQRLSGLRSTRRGSPRTPPTRRPVRPGTRALGGVLRSITSPIATKKTTPVTAAAPPGEGSAGRRRSRRRPGRPPAPA